MKDVMLNSYYEPPGEWIARNDEIQAMNKLCRFQRYKNSCVVTGTIAHQNLREAMINLTMEDVGETIGLLVKNTHSRV